MRVWYSEGIKALELEDGKWYRIEIDYSPPLGLIFVDRELVACFKDGEGNGTLDSVC